MHPRKPVVLERPASTLQGWDFCRIWVFSVRVEWNAPLFLFTVWIYAWTQCFLDLLDLFAPMLVDTDWSWPLCMLMTGRYTPPLLSPRKLQLSNHSLATRWEFGGWWAFNWPFSKTQETDLTLCLSSETLVGTFTTDSEGLLSIELAYN